MEYTHFRKIADVPEYRVFLEEVQQYEKAERWSTKRRDRLPNFRHTLAIYLRNASIRLSMQEMRDAQMDYLDIKNYPYFKKTYHFLEHFSRSIKGTLSRVLIVSLESNSEVYAHVDVGSYYVQRDRYHLVLESQGSLMCSGEEEVVFKEGELWWFDNKTMHSARNNGSERRVHIIFDVLPMRSLYHTIGHFFERMVAEYKNSTTLHEHKI